MAYLQLADDLEFRARLEVGAFLAQQQAQIPRHVATGNVCAHDGVLQRESLVDRHRVSHTVAGVQNNAGRSPSGIPGHDRR